MQETAPQLWLDAHQERIIKPCCLAEKVAEIKASGQTIVTLNGSFDLLHAGHLQILFEASQLADCFIVALNSDASIRQYKSPTRPIIPLAYRMQMMAAIRFVDYVTWFDETDPRRILNIIQPAVHVNGANYGEACIEAETIRQGGGKLHLTAILPGLSTSEIIHKIQHLQDLD